MTEITEADCIECMKAELGLPQWFQRKAERAIKEFFKDPHFNQEPITWIQKKFDEKDWATFTAVFAITDEFVHHPKKNELTSTSDPDRFKVALERIIDDKLEGSLINIEKYSTSTRLKWGEDRHSGLFEWIRKTLVDTMKNLEFVRDRLSKWLKVMEEKGLRVYLCIEDSLHYAKTALTVVATRSIDKVVDKFSENGGESFWLQHYFEPKDMKLDEPLEVDLGKYFPSVSPLHSPPPLPAAPVLYHQPDPSDGSAISTFPGNSPVPPLI